MQGILNRIIKVSLYSLVFLMPLFWLPFSFEAFEFNKLYLLFFLSAIAFFSWLLKMILVDGEIRFKRTPLDIPIVGFLFLAVLSAIFSVDKLSSLFGFYGRFSDGLIALISLVIVYFLITNNTSSPSLETPEQKPVNLKGLLKVFSWSFSLVILLSYFSVLGIWQKISSLAGLGFPALTLQKFFNPAAGSLEGLAIFLAVIAVFLTGLILIRDKNEPRNKTVFHWSALVVSLALLIVINFRSAWLVLAVSLIIFLAFALSKRLFKKSVNRLLLPILLVIFSSVLSFGTFRFPLLSLAKEQVLDQETSWQASFGAARENLKAGFLGTGVGTWHYDFTKHKPASFNQNSLWQFRFDRSGSHFSEVLGTLGFLGLFLYLGLLGLFFLTGWLLISGKSGKEFGETKFNLPFLMAVLGLTVGQLFYYQNLVLAFVFWLFLALAAVVWQGSGEKIFSLKKFPELNLVFSTFLIAVGLGVVALFFFGVRFYLADNLFLKVQKENSLDNQIAVLEKIVKLNPYQAQYWSLLSRAYLQKTREESARSGPQDQEKIIGLVNAARSAADRALEKGPSQVAAAETLAIVYRELRGFPEGQDRAVKSFERAINLEPNNPVLKIELARLLTATDMERAKREVELAQKIKPEYLDAMLLETAILEQEGNLEGAVRAMEKVVSSYPFNLEARFQLGLLYFNSKKYDDAISQLESVLILAPKHSNALYSLGLTYQRKGNATKAKSYFEKVLELNPDSQDVKEKLKELE